MNKYDDELCEEIRFEAGTVTDVRSHLAELLQNTRGDKTSDCRRHQGGLLEAGSETASRHRLRRVKDCRNRVTEDAVKRFQELAEAFAVLSNLEKRSRYDFDYQRNPDVLKADIHETRDVDGVAFRQKSAVGNSDFAQDYRQRIQMTRAEWNVDENGNYKGGLPRRHRGKIRYGDLNCRGTGLGYSGEFCKPTDVRGREHQESAELFVDEHTVNAFKNMKIDDWRYYLGDWTWWKAEVTYEFKPFTDNSMLFRYLKYLTVFFMTYYVFSHWQAASTQRTLSLSLK